jgi:hypothetical protein
VGRHNMELAVMKKIEETNRFLKEMEERREKRNNKIII